jgi:hypothetical protein
MESFHTVSVLKLNVICCSALGLGRENGVSSSSGKIPRKLYDTKSWRIFSFSSTGAPVDRTK